MVSDKTVHKAFRTHTTLYKQNPLEKFSIFTKSIYQNYTLALIALHVREHYQRGNFHAHHCLHVYLLA